MLFHIDNLMTVCNDANAVTDFVKKLDDMHGENGSLTVICRMMRKCLGIGIKFGLKRK